MQYLIGQLNVPINEFVNFIRELQDARISLDRIGEIRSLENEEKPKDITSGPSLLLLEKVAEPDEVNLRFEKVSFRYEGPHSPKAIDNIDLTIEEGKITAIGGASGSGKTTLLELLTVDDYPPTAGKILLGHTDLLNKSAREWRSQCGTVMQDGYIFSDTIANNISVSDEEMNTEKLLHAVRVANIKEFIEALPLGYNTKIGGDGSGISAGQRQRILIARAVYRDPHYLFFDEATSALDANNEKVIMDNLNEFFIGRTVVVIAHRRRTVKNADKIVVLEGGKVVEEGNHAELTATKGKYYELVKNQLELGN